MALSASDIVIVSGCRTSIADYGGGLADQPATSLGATVIKEALSRAKVDGNDVDQVVMGNVIHGEPRDMYVSRVAALEAGIRQEAPAMTLNRLCGSGLQAIISAAQMIMLGDATIAVAGGTESMSRAAYSSTGMRWGARMGDAKMIDMMVGALTDPFGNGHMGITAENVAQRHQIGREEQDAFSVESHHRAAKAISEGRFKDQIVPVIKKTRKGEETVDADEHVRGDVDAAKLGKLRPAFKKEGGTVTAGNASGVNDGAAAVVLMTMAEAEKRGLKPMGRILGYGLAGVDPSEMGMGPVPAVNNLLDKTGLKIDDFDVIEANEAFAAQALAVAKQLGLPGDRTNPNGGAVALGHPIGATGAIITVKNLYELERIGGSKGLITMCIGGGQGIAMAVERVN